MDLVLWLFMLTVFLQPAFAQGMLVAARLQMLVRLEKKRSSRVIALVQRQERLSVLGFPVLRYIDMEDSESVMNAIRLTDPNLPIDIIIHSPGSEITAAEQISAALVRHPSKVTVFVPHYAMSGAALIALAANELVMNPDAVLGALEPQIGLFPADSVLKVIERKSIEEIEDKTWILADGARKARVQMKAKVKGVLEHRMEHETADRIAEILTSGQWTLDYPISVDELKDMGLAINTEMPLEVYQLMNLYAQPRETRPSVSYIPVPYKHTKG